MTQAFASPQVTCRPAIARDHADVAEFCKGIWEGDDYVPDVWPHWYKDPHGVLVTAEYNGHAIGCAKLSRIADGQWWLEGVRVDPNKQGLKVGSQIHNYITAWWIAHCDGIVRLMTENSAVVHLCEKTGFSKIRELRGYRALPIHETVANISLASNISEISAFALQTETVQRNDRLIDFGWRFGMLTPQALENYSGYKADSPALAPGASVVHTFHWWKDKQGLFSAWEDEENGRRQLVLGVLACAMDDMPAMLTDIRRFAAQERFDRVFLLASLDQIFIEKLEQAGFSTSWENYLRLFERQ